MIIQANLNDLCGVTLTYQIHYENDRLKKWTSFQSTDHFTGNTLQTSLINKNLFSHIEDEKFANKQSVCVLHSVS